jgi:hypothetical protein
MMQRGVADTRRRLSNDWPSLLDKFDCAIIYGMHNLVSNPYFQLLWGTLIGFAGSVAANRMYFGKIEKGRAERETQRAYNKLVNRFVRTTISDASDPLHLLPLDVSDRVEDLRFALADVNRQFDCTRLVQEAIQQAAALRRQQEGHVTPPSVES